MLGLLLMMGATGSGNPPGTITYMSDDFNRADSGTVGNGWTEIGGGLRILSNRLYTSSLTSSAIWYDPPLYGVDGFWAELDMSSVFTFGQASIGFRSTTGSSLGLGGGFEADNGGGGEGWVIGANVSASSPPSFPCRIRYEAYQDGTGIQQDLYADEGSGFSLVHSDVKASSTLPTQVTASAFGVKYADPDEDIQMDDFEAGAL